MLIRFTDDYVPHIFRAYETIGQIQQYLCIKEPFMGNSQQLDKLYALSIVISGIAEQLKWDDNSDPDSNEGLLLCLKKYIDKADQLCKCRRPVLDVRKLHNRPVAEETVFELHNFENTRTDRREENQ